MRPDGRRVRSGAFGPFPSALVVDGFVQVRSIPSRQLWESGVFPSALGVVVLVRVRSVHSRAPWFGWVPSCTFDPLSCAHWVVVLVRVHRYIPVRPGVRSCTFGPFKCAMGIVGFIRVR